jgi:glycosyltransferase involved in cell wall biosynthesis
MDISVIICCYNSSRRITPTLQALVKQRYSSLRWEVLLVDNCCTDDTISVAQCEWKRTDVPLRIISAPIAGLIHARNAGVEAASGELLVFCDDDNWFAEEYLSSMHERFKKDRLLGVACGVGKAVTNGFELPVWFSEHESMFACGIPSDLKHVTGAGMTTRRDTWNHILKLPFPVLLTGRNGKLLTSGEDLEYCYKARVIGLKTQVFPDLIYKHEMTESRMTLIYLQRLARANGLTYPVLLEYMRLEKLYSGKKLTAVTDFFPLWLLCILGSIRGFLISSTSNQLTDKNIHNIKLRQHRIGSGEMFWRFLTNGTAFNLRSTFKNALSVAKRNANKNYE